MEGHTCHRVPGPSFVVSEIQILLSTFHAILLHQRHHQMSSALTAVMRAVSRWVGAGLASTFAQSEALMRGACVACSQVQLGFISLCDGSEDNGGRGYECEGLPATSVQTRP